MRAAKSRHAEPLAVMPDSRCQTAQCSFVPAARCCARVVRLFACAFAFASAGEPTGASAPAAVATAAIPSPRRGVDGAPTGALFLSVAPASATTLSRGDRDLSRRSTVAVFGCGPTKPAPGSGTGAASDCPRQAVRPGGRGPDLPAVRFAPRPRDATPRSAFRIVSRRRPSERGCASYISTSICSQDINSYRSRQSTGGGGGLHVVSK